MKVPENSWTRRDQRRFAKSFALLPECDLPAGSVWADLGCGHGIFSAALAHLLGNDGRVFAIDIDHSSLMNLRRNAAQTHWRSRIQPIRGDLRDSLPLHGLDGLLLANVLHFFEETEKLSLLSHLHAGLRPGGELILVEYNSSNGNPAVPYPLSVNRWQDFLEKAGWKRVRIQARVRSSFFGEMAALQAISGI